MKFKFLIGDILPISTVGQRTAAFAFGFAIARLAPGGPFVHFHLDQSSLAFIQVILPIATLFFCRLPLDIIVGTPLVMVWLGLVDQVTCVTIIAIAVTQRVILSPTYDWWASHVGWRLFSGPIWRHADRQWTYILHGLPLTVVSVLCLQSIDQLHRLTISAAMRYKLSPDLTFTAVMLLITSLGLAITIFIRQKWHAGDRAADDFLVELFWLLATALIATLPGVFSATWAPAMLAAIWFPILVVRARQQHHARSRTPDKALPSKTVKPQQSPSCWTRIKASDVSEPDGYEPISTYEASPIELPEVFEARRVAISHDGSVIAIAGRERVVTLKSTDGTVHSFSIASDRLAISGDGNRLAVSAGRIISILDLEDVSVARKLTCFRKPTNIALSGNGERVAAILSGRAWGGKPLIAWSVGTGCLLTEIFDGRDLIGLSFVPDGNAVSSSIHRARSLLVWDLHDGSELIELTHSSPPGRGALSQTVLAVAYQPSTGMGSMRYIGTAYGPCLCIWDAERRRLKYNFLHQPITIMHTVVFSPDGEFVASGTNRGVVLWGLVPGRFIARIDCPSTYIRFIDARTMLVSGTGGKDISRIPLDRVIESSI
jgi:hypothetical protein